MSDIIANIDELIVLCEKKIQLLHELKRALRLAELIGVPPKEIKGKLRHWVVAQGAGHRVWQKKEFVVTLDDKEMFRGPLTSVHFDLWPADVFAEYRRFKNRRDK